MTDVLPENRAPGGVLAAPETEVRGRTNCNHPENRRREGARQPARWGSWPTEECTMCGAWRALPHGKPEPWQHASVPRSEEDDDV